MPESAAERKRKRLEAWRKRQQQQQKLQKPKLKLQLNIKKTSAALNDKNLSSITAAFGGNDADADDDDDDDIKNSNGNVSLENRSQKKLQVSGSNNRQEMSSSLSSNKKRRWDANHGNSSLSPSSSISSSQSVKEVDALDAYMKETVVNVSIGESIDEAVSIRESNREIEVKENDSEDEEAGRRALIEALRSHNPTGSSVVNHKEESTNNDNASKNSDGYVASKQIQNAKLDRANRIAKLEAEVRKVRYETLLKNSDETRFFDNDAESGVMEETERKLTQLKNSDTDALVVLAELNKKKELRSVDHSKIEYLRVTKNLYVVPRALASLSNDEVMNRRGALNVRVRGVGCPAPITSFDEGGLSERMLTILSNQGITTPYPIQAQCLPAIMAGRDVIGIAKTGSGKTLAFLLPMLRHVQAQPDLYPYESGPIGLVLAPARELAVQIHMVCKTFCKNIGGLRSTAVYGGAGVAEQIGDLKRGAHVVVATPGRMIDLLTMQSGKLLSLKRVSFVVMDEADRMFDMGFAPQIDSIVTAVRPDRQTVLFSATFPKAVEQLARKSLQYPIEVLVGGRSVASDTITQYAECMEEGDKFLRLLQVIGEHVFDDDEDDEDNDDKVRKPKHNRHITKKCIVFVDTQVRADALFEQLVRAGYVGSCLSLHGGKDQEDRDNTLSDFKKPSGQHRILVATSVAGRGLDVPSVACVVNYSTPSHLEEYVHRVGRTGRAGRKGVAFTFINPNDESKFAPIVVRAMLECGQAERIQSSVMELSNEFKAKVQKGEASYAGSGFKGKGYSYDASELNDAQKLARLEKRQALAEAGMLDEDQDSLFANNHDDDEDELNPIMTGSTGSADTNNIDPSANKTPTVLTANIQDAIMRKLGLSTTKDGSSSSDHFTEDMDINDFPREARWKVTQKETVNRMQDEYGCAITLKGEYVDNYQRKSIVATERLHLHIEAQTRVNLLNCVHEIRRLINEETLRVSNRNPGSGGGGMMGSLTNNSGGGRYNVLG